MLLSYFCKAVRWQISESLNIHIPETAILFLGVYSKKLLSICEKDVHYNKIQIKKRKQYEWPYSCLFKEMKVQPS